MKFSIITVSYNAVSTIEKTLLSIYNQTYKDYEHIIIDGGSSDGTVDVIRKYEDRIAYWISEPDKGVYDAMNKAIEKAKGDWFLYINSDDILINNDTLLTFSSELKDSHTIYYGDVLMMPQKKFYGGAFNKWRMTRSNICHQSIFYPSAVFKHHSYDLRFRLFADWVLNMMCMGETAWTFQYIPHPVTIFNSEGLSCTWNDPEFMEKRYGLIRHYLGVQYELYARVRHIVHVIICLFNRNYGK